ncbi:hypothetical protein E4U41_004895, partial [Claviceps citrina]
AENGNKLGLRNDNVYYAAPDSMIQRYGKFQLCGDDKCAPGQAVNPSKQVYIRDTYGDLATGANRGQWLNNAQNGAHIGRTPDFALAGKFSLSRWPCGRYCLGGFTAGVGAACPADVPAMTFYSQDPQMCVAFELVEVPCDLKNDANSCIWKSGDQCCNKVDCGGKGTAGQDPASTKASSPLLSHRDRFVLLAVLLAAVVLMKSFLLGGSSGGGSGEEEEEEEEEEHVRRWNKKTGSGSGPESYVVWDALFANSAEEMLPRGTMQLFLLVLVPLFAVFFSWHGHVAL